MKNKIESIKYLIETFDKNPNYTNDCKYMAVKHITQDCNELFDTNYLDRLVDIFFVEENLLKHNVTNL